MTEAEAMAMQILRRHRLRRVAASDPRDSKSLQSVVGNDPKTGYVHSSIEIVTPTEAESVAIALAIETLSQSEDGTAEWGKSSVRPTHRIEFDD